MFEENKFQSFVFLCAIQEDYYQRYYNLKALQSVMNEDTKKWNIMTLNILDKIQANYNYSWSKALHNKIMLHDMNKELMNDRTIDYAFNQILGVF